MTAAYTPADEANGLAAVGETIVYRVQSTNNGNVDVDGVTMLDTVGGLRNQSYGWGSTACSSKHEELQQDSIFSEIFSPR